MEGFRADLHSHSTCSDGQLTPQELLQRASEVGLQGLSITDHDTVEAYTPELFSFAKTLGVQLCTGVELSCQIHKASVHILGYAMDPHCPQLVALCTRHKQRRLERNKRILSKLTAHGMPISQEELLGDIHAQVIGRPHIAHLMIKKGYVASVAEAFHRYLGDGKCCFDAGEAFSVDEAIDIIHQAEGKAFIAHPHLIQRKKILRELLKKPFDGLECYYGAFELHQNRKWLELAQQQGWLISGGSDFHGDSKPYIYLGSSWVNEEAFLRIMGKSL